MKSRYFLFAIAIFIFSQLIPLDACLAYWIWTPEIGKWINPKHAVKPTPKEQYDWAFKLYKDKEYSKAAEEFDKLVFNYPNSKYAPPSLYYKGVCLEEIEYYYEAYRSYDRVLREYPTFKNIEEIIEREFKIGEKFLAGRKRKVMGVKIFPSLELAIEIFASIAEHAPFSEYGAKSQFNVGVALKKAERYTEAKEAFEKVILNYPNSEIVTRARFEAANCSFLASGEADYEQTATRQAINELTQFLNEESQGGDLSREAKEKLLLLQEKDAEHLYNIAKFYERMKKFKAAHIYYKEVIDKYPQTSSAAKAKEKLEKLKEGKK